MRIPSGVTDQYIYFVAVDATDYASRETGLSSFTVYRSRNGAAAAAMTTPTINETDATNMPGVYELLLDEDMTIGAGNDSEEIVYHITHAGMAPVTRTIELYRPKLTIGNTLDVTATGAAGIDWGNIENKTTANDLSGTDIQLCDTVTTLTGHTAQTGDSYARLGAPAGASVSADIATIDTNVDGVKTKTDSLTFTVANQVDSNAVAISGDTTAADNLEATYDGTGYTDDEAPAKQSQLSSIANVGSAVHKPSSSYTLTTGTQSANLYTDTEALDGVRHTHTDIANSIDLYYEFMIGGGTPTSVQVTGYLTGLNDDLLVQGYDWVSTSWKQIGTLQGTSSTTNQVFSYDLFVDMVGSGANDGKVRVRFYKASGLSSATLAIDQIFVAFSQGSEGYDNGAVWFNSNASNTGTEVNIDGTARNPVSTSAALLSLLASTNLKKIEVVAGSTLTLGAAYEGYDINGNGSVLVLNNQDIGGSIFNRFSDISGVGTTTANKAFFEDCIFQTATVPPMIAQQCGYGATLSLGGAGDYTFVDCYSTVAGAGAPTFNRTGAGTATVEFRRWSGGTTQSGITGSDTYTLSGQFGNVTLNGASGAVELRGIYKSVTDNRIGSPTLDSDGAIKGVDVATVLTYTNNLNNDWSDAGRLDTIIDSILEDTGTTLDTHLTDIKGATFNNSTDSLEAIRNKQTDIETDTQDIQSRVPSALVGGRMDSNMSAINNDNTAAVNLSKSALGIIYGTAQTGTLSTTQASTDLSGYSDDQLIGRVIVWTSGNCQGEATDITDYANTNGVLTFTALTTAPANADTFVIV